MTDILGPANAVGAVTTRPADDRTIGALDTWFKDCSDIEADDGTDIRAASLIDVVGALRALWRVNGNLIAGGTPVNSETTDLNNGLVRAAQYLVQRGKPNYAADSGSTNALVVTLVPAPAELTAGMTLRTKLLNAITGAATVKVNALAAVPVKNRDGSDLVAGVVRRWRNDRDDLGRH